MSPLASILLSAVATAQAGDLPRVQATWEPGQALFVARGPRGEHIEEAAPASGWISVGETRVAIDGTGALLASGVAVPTDTWRSRPVQGELSLSLCADQGTLCRLVDVDLSGVLEGRSGKAALEVSPRRKPTSRTASMAPIVREPTQRPVGPAGSKGLPPDAAMAAAAAGKKPILLDFSAIWCPPCNQMLLEVLHDPDDADLLGGFQVIEVDADARESWALKSRYAVGGYPTVVVTSPDGQEIDRQVGYTTEAAFVAWLGSLGGKAPVSAPPDPRTLAPDAAAPLALRMVEAGRAAEAAPFLARAAEAPAASWELRLARVLVDANSDDALWLCAERPDLLTRWAWGAVGQPDPTARPVGDAIVVAARRRLPEAAAPEASDLLALIGQVQIDRGDAAAGQLSYAAAAATLSASLSGVNDHDRPFLTTLSDLWVKSGDPQASRAPLQRGADAWPHDPTFFLAMARLLNDQGEWEAALPYAVAGMSLAWGDNHLRTVAQAARALHGIGRKDEALALIDQTLAAAERPQDGVAVRTPRYISALETLRSEIAD